MNAHKRTPKNDRISVSELRALIEYYPESGSLRWKARGLAWFDTRYAGKLCGAIKKGYVQVAIKIDGKCRFFGGHRVAWALFYGQWPDGIIDHIDGNGMNNSIQNLRCSSYSQNSCNRRDVVGSIKYRGVYYIKRLDKYGATIKFEGKRNWLGCFKTPQQAAMEYDAAAKKLHGQFAVTNQSLGLL